MRAYFFGNFYLSSIQQGIQALHVTSDLFVKYKEASSQRDQLFEWAEHGKTVICLNGGNCDGLEDIRIFLNSDQNPYPWNYFREDHASLNLAITSVGIVVPSKIYNSGKTLDGEEVFLETDWEVDLVTLLAKYPLA